MISLSDGEWKIMNLLWKEAPKTIMEMTKQLQETTGWSKNTVITMLNRMEKKGAVCYKEGERAKKYYPIVLKEEIIRKETKGFLDKVYKGSLSLMVHEMVSSNAVSKKDIAELYEILKQAEEENND